MPTTGLSNRIRSLAKTRYVNPAIQAGKQQFSIRVRDVLNDLEREGLSSPGRTPQICNALRTAKFLNANGLEIEAVDGPPKKQSPTVVVRYRVKGNKQPLNSGQHHPAEARNENADESASARAFRLTERLRGLLKEEMAAYGGGEAFLRWVRREDEAPR